MHNDGEREPLFKAIEENYKENRYVTKPFKKYLPFIFTEDDVLKVKFKNKVLLVVPKSLRYEIISLSHSEGIVDISEYSAYLQQLLVAHC